MESFAYYTSTLDKIFQILLCTSQARTARQGPILRNSVVRKQTYLKDDLYHMGRKMRTSLQTNEK